MADRLPPTVRTLYAELMDLSETDAADRYVLPSFAKKQNRRGIYWYESSTVAGKKVQKYYAPDNEDGRRRVEQRKREIAVRRAAFETRSVIVRALTAAAGRAVDPATGRVLKALADAGAFAAGALVVGDAACSTYRHMFGRKSDTAGAPQNETDATGLDLAIPEPASFAGVIQSAEDSLLLASARGPAGAVTALKIRGGNFRVELFAPAADGSDAAIAIGESGFSARPSAGLDYLVEQPVAAVVPVEMGIRVSVPRPERFAVHKLIAAQDRPRDETAKRETDLLQARNLIEALREDLPRDLATAWADLDACDPGYREMAVVSLTQLEIDPASLA